jgi:hypothetical protein
VLCWYMVKCAYCIFPLYHIFLGNIPPFPSRSEILQGHEFLCSQSQCSEFIVITQ